MANILSTNGDLTYLVVSPANDKFTYVVTFDIFGNPLYTGVPNIDIFPDHSTALKCFLAKGAKIDVQGDGVIGMMYVDNFVEIAIVDKSELTGIIPGGHYVKTIRHVTFYQIPKQHNYKSVFEDFQLNDNHYFCDSYDMTNLFPANQSVTPDSSFIWNSSWRQAFHMLSIPQCCIYLIQGLVMTSEFKEFGFSISYVVRRSVLNPGTRYAGRGLNGINAPGNEVECELIFAKKNRFWTKSWRRGSIPIRWKTIVSSKVFAKHKVETNFFDGTAAYFRSLQKHYDNQNKSIPIHCISLLETSKDHSESEIYEFFYKSFDQLREVGVKNVDLVNYDLNERLQLYEFEEVFKDFIFTIDTFVQSDGFSSGIIPNIVDYRQKGIMRFNCADSLDRTNIATFFFAILVTSNWCKQLHVGLSPTPSNLPNRPDLDIHPDILNFLVSAFLESGNVISMLYTNTPAIKTNIFRFFQPSVNSASDSSISVRRRVENIVYDPQRMKVIYLWLKQPQFTWYHQIDSNHLFVLQPNNAIECIFETTQERMYEFPSIFSEFTVCFLCPFYITSILTYLTSTNPNKIATQIILEGGKTLDSMHYLTTITLPEVEETTWLRFNIINNNELSLPERYNDYIRYLRFKVDVPFSSFTIGTIKFEAISFFSCQQFKYIKNRECNSEDAPSVDSMIKKIDSKTQKSMMQILENEIYKVNYQINVEEYNVSAVKHCFNPWLIDAESQLMIHSPQKCLLCQKQFNGKVKISAQYKPSKIYPGLIKECDKDGTFFTCKKCYEFSNHISLMTNTFEHENKVMMTLPLSFAITPSLQQNLPKLKAIGTHGSFVPANSNSNILHPSSEEVTIEKDETKEFLYYVVNSAREADMARERIAQIAQEPLSLFIFHNFLGNTQNEKTRFIVLNVIAQNIPTQWETLRDIQKEAFRKYYFDLLVEWPKTDISPTILRQLDVVIVQILFMEWPHNWPTFMNDLILSVGSHENSILNTTYFFALFSKQLRNAQLLSDRKQELIQSLHKNFETIYNFLSIIFVRSQSDMLRAEALQTLGEYLEWVDLRLIGVEKICDMFCDILVTHNNFSLPALKCLNAIVSRENAGADKLKTYIFNKFIKTVSLNFELLSDPELVPLFIRIVSKFICMDRCSLLPNDLLIELMLEYTKNVTDELFVIAIDTWHYVTQVFMLETSYLPFSPQLFLPLQYTLCSRMIPPPEFNGDKQLFEKMSETLLLLFKVNHDNILQLLLEKIRNPQSIEELLPFIYSIGSISGICTIEEENQFLTEILNILLKNSNGNEVLTLSTLYLISHYQRYLYNQKDLLLFSLQQFYQYFLNGSDEAQTIALKVFYTLTKSCGKIIVDNGFAQPFFENISAILSHISPYNHILYYVNMINIVKTCNNPQIKQQMIIILLNFASSYEILTELMQIVPQTEQLQVEKIISNIMIHFPECKDQIQFHAIYELFKAFLKVFPNTNLLDQLIQMFFNEFEVTHSFESFDCFTILIENGNVGLIPIVFNRLIRPTFSEISSSFSEHPEHRLSFYSLIKAIFKHFNILDKDIFTELFNYTFFGLQHPQNNISELSLNCISSIIEIVDKSDEIIEDFYQSLYVEIISCLFTTIFDGMHSFLFLQITPIISYLIQLVIIQRIQFIHVEDLEQIIFQKMNDLFPNREKGLIFTFVKSLINNSQNITIFRQIFNNFLVTIKQVTADQIDAEMAISFGLEKNGLDLINEPAEEYSSMILESEAELEEI
ncbi:SacI domain containing protein [Histomonas meleagridis]|uniref:SacI-like domain containing protein n=1 Tax=Histomonas meleagridis TaxID=135588 RepID=UPI00355A2CF6|nr:SacI domain containing protein [Histomonas meleagridis]KAH0800972.1 SacI-like domain containing protein [Histomonas meleagridis]